MRIVKVIWKDARTLSETSSLKELKKIKLPEAQTIGYLIDENNERIVVCGFFFPKDESMDDYEYDGYRDTHFIPKGMIKKIIELKECNDVKKNVK